MPKFQARQGDVYIREIDPVRDPGTLVPRESGRLVLAHGEVTGHAHAIHNRGATLFRDDGLGRTVLTTTEPCQLVHEEHGTIELPAGRTFEVRRQAEYSLGDLRQVAD